MLIRLRWPNCPLLTSDDTRVPAYFLECTEPEARALMPHLHPLHAAQAEHQPRWPLFFLVDVPGTRLEPVERVLPYSGMWNSDNPFQALEHMTVTAIAQLPWLQPMLGQWHWPAELA